MKDTEIAWLAGLLEGEGCISFKSANSVALVIGMTDRDVIERIRTVTGVGNIYTQTYPPEQNRKPKHHWEIGTKQEVEKLILLLLPWMGERRSEKMQEALKRLENNKGTNRPIEHGTRKGYRMEQRRGIENCEECREAHLKYYRDRNKAKSRAKDAHSG